MKRLISFVIALMMIITLLSAACYTYASQENETETTSESEPEQDPMLDTPDTDQAADQPSEILDADAVGTEPGQPSIPTPPTIEQPDQAKEEEEPEKPSEQKPSYRFACGYDGSIRSSMPSGNPGESPRYELSLRKWLMEKDELIVISGDLWDDILTVARSQVGYVADDTFCDENGALYTRYGEWYGWKHASWCDMFVSFCVYFAGLIDYPFEASCQRHMFNLKEAGYWRGWNNYIPKPGDIVFMNLRDKSVGMPTHVGIIEEVVPATATHPAYLKTIEGNIRTKQSGSGVGREIRYIEDVVGYGTYEEGIRLEGTYSYHFGDSRDIAIVGTDMFTDYPTVEALDFLGMGDTEYFDFFFANGIDDIQTAIEKEQAMLQEEIKRKNVLPATPKPTLPPLKRDQELDQIPTR